MSLITCGSIHEGHEWFSDDSRGRRDFYVFGCSIMWAILLIREWRCQDIDQSPTSWDHFFCLSVFSSSEVLGKITSIRSKLADCSLLVSGRKERKLWSQPALACFVSKATTTDKSFTVFFARWGVKNLNVDSKSQPVELGNSTIELHVPPRRKKSLQSYCSVDFDFLGLMRFDVTFDVMLRDDSSFGKLTNSCN